MLKFISLIILYLLVISSVFGLIIYEETGENIDTINTYSYSGDFVDLSGDMDLDLITDSSITDSLLWELTGNTLVYNYTGITALQEPIYFSGIKENDDGNYDVEYAINNIDNLDFDIYITQGGILDTSSYILSYNDGIRNVLPICS